MSTGTVSIWHGEEGWGVIESADTPGGCWAFYSHIWADALPELKPGHSRTIRGGYRELIVGESVDFTWEPVEQDGYSYRAISVTPRREHPQWTIEDSPA